MERVMIIGCAGVGKSTLARKLGALTGLPVIHLDREHWRPGWVESPTDEWNDRVSELAGGERWIIDGNYIGTMTVRMSAADTVIFLDFPRRICLARVLSRMLTGYGKSRPDMTEGCEEKLDIVFLKWIWDFPKHSRPRNLEMIEKYREGRTIHHLRSPRELKAFLDELERHGAR